MLEYVINNTFFFLNFNLFFFSIISKIVVLRKPKDVLKIVKKFLTLSEISKLLFKKLAVIFFFFEKEFLKKK